MTLQRDTTRPGTIVIGSTRTKQPEISIPGIPATSVIKDKQIPAISTLYTKNMYTRHSKGQLLSSGASGILEILPCGDVIKSPWPGPSEIESRRDITVEYEIYKKLGPYLRLVKIVDWDPQECCLTMEFMPEGNLYTFLTTNNGSVTERQRLRWAREAAEGLQLLHTAGVLHCDVHPKNFLLDADLDLKIADFGGSSLAGSKPSACSEVRFATPKKCWREPPTVPDDLFALGTTIFFIMTGHLPYPEQSDEDVEERFRHHVFPDVEKMACGDVVQRCWIGCMGSAQAVWYELQCM